jgi:hypothetical protein
MMMHKGKGLNGRGQLTYQNNLEANNYQSEGNSKNVVVDSNGSQRTTMGRVSWFGWFVCYSLDNSTTEPIGGVFAHLGIHKGWTHLSSCLW